MVLIVLAWLVFVGFNGGSAKATVTTCWTTFFPFFAFFSFFSLTYFSPHRYIMPAGIFFLFFVSFLSVKQQLSSSCCFVRATSANFFVLFCPCNNNSYLFLFGRNVWCSSGNCSLSFPSRSSCITYFRLPVGQDEVPCVNHKRRRKIPSAAMGAARRRRKACIIVDSPGGEDGGKREVETKTRATIEVHHFFS